MTWRETTTIISKSTLQCAPSVGCIWPTDLLWEKCCTKNFMKTFHYSYSPFLLAYQPERRGIKCHRRFNKAQKEKEDLRVRVSSIHFPLIFLCPHFYVAVHQMARSIMIERKTTSSESTHIILDITDVKSVELLFCRTQICKECAKRIGESRSAQTGAKTEGAWEESHGWFRASFSDNSFDFWWEENGGCLSSEKYLTSEAESAFELLHRVILQFLHQRKE